MEDEGDAMMTDDVGGGSASAAATGGKSSVPPGERFEVKKWSAVALWAWDIQVCYIFSYTL
jgi:hypothetical protein